MAPEKKGSKIGNMGGPLLGGATRMAGKVARRSFQTGEQAAQGMTERNRGRAAHRANQAGSFLTRIVYSLMGGQVAPTRHQTAARIKRGHDHDTRLNEQSASILTSRADRVHGVAARKAVYVEAARNGGRDAEQAIMLLLGSESWVEFQNSLIQGGRNAGKRVTEIGEWQEVLQRHGNEQLWQKVGRSRPDLTPDIMQVAERDLGNLLGRQVTYDGLVGGAARPLLDELSRLGLTASVNRLNVNDLAGLHEGYFTEIARLGEATLSTDLLTKLRTIKSIPRVGTDALGTYAGGPRQAALDAALAVIGESYATI